MRKKKSSGVFAQVLITTIGAAILAWGLILPVLRIAGQRGTAVIDTVRRELGERNEVIPNRYTYNIGYSFTLPDGRKINGFSRRIGDAVYFKAGGSSTAPVRYFSFFPYINALEEDTEPNYRHLILIVTGAFLIYIVNRHKKKQKRASAKIS
jgi:hypothetical protein